MRTTLCLEHKIALVIVAAIVGCASSSVSQQPASSDQYPPRHIYPASIAEKQPLSPEQLADIQLWSKSVDPAFVRAVQRYFSLPETGHYDQTTTMHVADKQRRLGILIDGKADHQLLKLFGDLQEAVTWAKLQNINPNAISNLQDLLKVEHTGTYDERTALAVYQQQEILHIPTLVPNGHASIDFFDRFGRIFYRNVEPATTDLISDEQWNSIQANNGVTLAIYVNYEKGKDRWGETEFKKMAREFAGHFNGRFSIIGLTEGNSIFAGIYRKEHAGVSINNTSELTEAILRIHYGLLNRYRSRQQFKGNDIPEFTKIRNIAIFSHGESYGLALDADNRKGTHFYNGLRSETREAENQRSVYGDNLPNISAFVEAIRSASSNKLRIHLFACRTAQAKDQPSGKLGEIVMPRPYNAADVIKQRDKLIEELRGLVPKQGIRLGGDSFAGRLTGEFWVHGVAASVYGHTSAEHVYRNPNARGFGLDTFEVPDSYLVSAENGVIESLGDKEAIRQGMHMFDLLYPPYYVRDEVGKFVKDFPRFSKFYLGKDGRGYNTMHAQLRKKMWQHFVDCVFNKNFGTTNRIKEKAIGMEMFMDPKNAARILHEDWRINGYEAVKKALAVAVGTDLSS